MRAAWLVIAGLSVAGSAVALEAGPAGQRGGLPAVPFLAKQPMEAPAHGPADTGVDVLSDTKGVDFNPYVKGILKLIHDSWVPLLPAEARAPKLEEGDTLVRFTISPTGTILSMHLDGSTHNTALDNAAWGAITGVGHFPALPREFTGPNLELRIHFLVNKDARTQQPSIN